MKKKVIKKTTNPIEALVNPILHPKNFGEKMSDNIAKWAGSWTFILSFLLFLGLWMAANIYMWLNQWDPYPFILLNLVLSCIAALQAPVILMSQNRSAIKDHQRFEYDYTVNRKSEREISDIQKQLNRIERRLNKK